jgi:EAL domain-containing protein (putative c-di-GMP-specific phosphodiesterase class I)
VMLGCDLLQGYLIGRPSPNLPAPHENPGKRTMNVGPMGEGS